MLNKNICHQNLEQINENLLSWSCPLLVCCPQPQMDFHGIYHICAFPGTSFQDLIHSLHRVHYHILPRNVCLICYLTSVLSWTFPKGKVSIWVMTSPSCFLFLFLFWIAVSLHIVENKKENNRIFFFIKAFPNLIIYSAYDKNNSSTLQGTA